MSIAKWRGDAPAIAQVNTITPASVTIGNTFTLTINGKAITVTATAATVANVTALLAAAVTASLIAEFQEVTAADITTALTLTANTPGKPFTQTSSSATGSGSGGHSMPTSTTTANSGPNNWDVAANWSGDAVPVNGDDAYLENSAVDILYGLSQSGVTLASLNIAASYTGKIGLPQISESGAYYEYRSRYLNIKASTVNIGYGDGSGSGRLLLDLDAAATTLNITSTGSAVDQAVPALCIKGSGSTYTPTILGGSVGFAVETGQSATIGTITVSGDSTVTLGSGCTLTTVNVNAGTVTINSAVTTLNNLAGTVYVMAGAVATLNADGGTVYYRSASTLTTLRIGTGATIDFTQDSRARTVSACTMEATGTLIDTQKTVTFTTGIVLTRCSLAEVTLDLGTNLTISASSIAAAVGAVRATSSLAKTSDTAFSDIPGLSVSLKAGTAYRIRAVIFAAGDAGGLAAKLLFSSALTSGRGMYTVIDVGFGAFANVAHASINTSLNCSSGGAATGPQLLVNIEATVVTNAACTLKVQGAQSQPDVSTTTFLANSSLEITECSN